MLNMKRKCTFYVNILLLTLNVSTIMVNAQTSKPDTIVIRHDDEFRGIKLSKFEGIEENKNTNLDHYRTILYYKGKPFNGVIKSAPGVTTNEQSSIIADYDYRESESEDSQFEINYLNGRFYKKYFFRNENIEVSLNYDINGNPDGKGYVKYLSPGGKHPVGIINLDTKISNDNKFIVGVVLNDEILKYDYAENGEALYLEAFIADEMLKYQDIEMSDISCEIEDTIYLKFNENKLEEIKFKDECETKIDIKPFTAITEMPVYDVIINSTGKHIDYTKFVTLADLTGSLNYYIDLITEGTEEYFYGNLENIPEMFVAKTKTKDLIVEYDKDKIKKEAKLMARSGFDGILQDDTRKGPLKGPIYRIDSKIKKYKWEDRQNNYYTKSEYKISEGKYEIKIIYFEIIENSDSGNELKDTIKINIKMKGNIITTTIDSLEYKKEHTNKEVYSQNVDMALKNLTIINKGSDKYEIKIEGEFPIINDKIITKMTIQTKVQEKNDGTIKLMPEGDKIIEYKDKTNKKYKYKNGEIQIE